MINKKHVLLLPFLVSALLMGCSSNNDKSSKSVEETSTREEKIEQDVKSQKAKLIGARDTVISMYTAASENNVDAFLNIAGSFSKSTGIPPKEHVISLTEMLSYKGGILEAVIEEVSKDELSPYYLDMIQSEFGQYGIDVVVVAEWSFNNDIEPISWVIQKQENENKIVRRDIDIKQGSKFTFFEGDKSQDLVNESIDKSDDVTRNSGRSTLYRLYGAAVENNHTEFQSMIHLDNNTEISSNELMSFLSDRVIEIGDTNGLRIEEIPHESIQAELLEDLKKEYGPHFEFFIEWMTEDYLNIFILKPINNSYFLIYSEDESKNEFLSDYVNDNYQYNFEQFNW